MLRRLKVQDFLESKQAEISLLSQQATQAVDLVTRTVEGLKDVNAKIDSAVSEIEEYSDHLQNIRGSMLRRRDANLAVIANFSKLLEPRSEQDP